LCGWHKFNSSYFRTWLVLIGKMNILHSF
jgi:hypothetical protein